MRCNLVFQSLHYGISYSLATIIIRHFDQATANNVPIKRLNVFIYIVLNWLI